VEGDGRRETGSKEGGKCTGDGRRGGAKREAGFPRWREAGEKGKNYVTLRNISQSKKCKEAGANKYRAGTGIKGYGKREV